MDMNQFDNIINEYIKVTNVVNADVEVENRSHLRMIGKGRQGAVFQASDDICIKVFGNEEDCTREHYALSLGQDTNLFPRIHAKGSLYIAMDLIKGVDLREYLQSQKLTQQLSYKLIQMLITFKNIGFERIDHHKRQIYIQPDGNLKVIDVGRSVWRDRVYPYPRKLLTSFGEENKIIFLSHVQEMAPELYEEWLHYIRMEELSQQIFQVLLSQKLDKATMKNLSKQLLTAMEEAKYLVSLEDLVHKVFKEEWGKTMQAQGLNPDDAMGKIVEDWDSGEMEQLRNQDWSASHGHRFAGISLRGSYAEKNYGRNSEKLPYRKKFEGEPTRDRISNHSSATGLKRRFR